jgi:hypothetical protein
VTAGLLVATPSVVKYWCHCILWWRFFEDHLGQFVKDGSAIVFCGAYDCDEHKIVPFREISHECLKILNIYSNNQR